MATPYDLPLSLRIIRGILPWLAHVVPALVVRGIYWRWFLTPRYAAPKRELQWLASAQPHTLPHTLGDMAYYRWGDAAKPYVLLMHGWSGRASQMGAFAQPLLDAGYAVVALDAPGHGKSPGTSTTIFKMADVLQHLVQQLGSPHAIISHSFGCLVTTYALAHGVTTQRVVMFSCPTRSDYLAKRFVAAMGLGDDILQKFLRHVEKQFGGDVWQRINADFNARDLTIPALLIHDRDDTDAEWQCSQWLLDAWRGATLVLTDKLGHRRILRDETMIAKTVAFIRDSAPLPPPAA